MEQNRRETTPKTLLCTIEMLLQHRHTCMAVVCLVTPTAVVYVVIPTIDAAEPETQTAKPRFHCLMILIVTSTVRCKASRMVSCTSPVRSANASKLKVYAACLTSWIRVSRLCVGAFYFLQLQKRDRINIKLVMSYIARHKQEQPHEGVRIAEQRM